MDEQTSKLIADLRAAESKRTPGAWLSYDDSVVYFPDGVDIDVLDPADAAYIALCSRAVPALLAALDSAERERDALKAALAKVATNTASERAPKWADYQRMYPGAEGVADQQYWFDKGVWQSALLAKELLQEIYPPPPPAPTTADWRAECVRWLQGDGHRYVAFRPLDMPLTYPQLAGVTWDDGAQNIALVFLAAAVTDDAIENARKVRTEYMGAQHLESAYALLIVPAGSGRAVADDAIAVAEWTGERVVRV